MPRIFYHNQIDVLSMVALTAKLCLAFDRPADTLRLGQEWLSLGRWYELLGRTEDAENAFRQALALDLGDDFRLALVHLGTLLKRAERRDEAAVVWQQLAAVEMDEVRGHVELAKYYEWHDVDWEQAAEWTRRAISLVDCWAKGLQALTRPELEHRLARLEHKLQRRDADRP